MKTFIYYEQSYGDPGGENLAIVRANTKYGAKKKLLKYYGDISNAVIHKVTAKSKKYQEIEILSDY